jgi:hypothetical protein
MPRHPLSTTVAAMAVPPMLMIADPGTTAAALDTTAAAPGIMVAGADITVAGAGAGAAADMVVDTAAVDITATESA